MADRKCAYLGCKNEGVILDEVEIAPGVLEKRFVCEEHLGQLVGNYEQVANLECISSKVFD
ncbi:hypothetical protein [Acetobacterium woodii]|uniref:Uncharacterized protein n=1 Tax=Acetobacterium woodii (strain ATCC 29683 / DSM 1030 / JCM 2381 / KCTC 1655 / WB1) TaxID=931626 RepID=H6LIX0_ACEWD|nr:hypothetical protein [Acetobacterium woodii]AFA49859.1 hypothetical protein Awo_c31310 [Acetobacterium woodii DSM 1030]